MKTLPKCSVCFSFHENDSESLPTQAILTLMYEPLGTKIRVRETGRESFIALESSLCNIPILSYTLASRAEIYISTPCPFRSRFRTLALERCWPFANIRHSGSLTWTSIKKLMDYIFCLSSLINSKMSIMISNKKFDLIWNLQT